MNPHKKWMDFSMRLINLMDITDNRREKIRATVINFINKFEDEEMHGWDTYAEYKFYGGAAIGGIAEDTTYFGEYRLDSMYEPAWNSFYNQISAVTRAGLDVATGDFGGGVMGYTIKDIIDMYDGNIPEWVLSILEITGREDQNDGVWL